MTAASDLVAACHAQTADGSPGPAHAEIRHERGTVYLPYAVLVFRGPDRTHESTSWVASEAEAVRLAAHLGYTEVVR